jgi:hypothetical protein
MSSSCINLGMVKAHNKELHKAKYCKHHSMTVKTVNLLIPIIIK